MRTSGARCSTCRRFEQAAEVFGAVLRTARPARTGGRVAGSACPTSTVRRRRPRPSGPRPPGRRARGPGSTRRLGSRPSRGVPSSPRPGMTLYTVGTIKKPPGNPDLRQRRRRHERQPAARALRERVRGLPPARRRRGEALPASGVVGKHCESGDLVVPEGFVPDDLRVGDILATPVTGAYGYAMASNYNKVPRPAVVFVAGGNRAPGRAPGDGRRHDAPRCVPGAAQLVAVQAGCNLVE